MKFYNRFATLVKDACAAINNYHGEKVVNLATGEKAINNDDAWIILGGDEPIIRDKREQRIRETYAKEGKKYPENQSSDKLLLDSFDYDELCVFADNLYEE
jgi:hypothetical protein